MKRPPVRIRTEIGSALIMTLLIITTLTGLTIAFSEESSVDLNLAGFSHDNSMARQAARSAVHILMAHLVQDEDRDMDSLREDWAHPEGQTLPQNLAEGVSIAGTVADECGKLNINALLNEEGEIDDTRRDELERLFAALGIPADRITPLLDWLDQDDIERLGGAESFYYQGLDEPRACANGPFLTIGQIFAVKGFDEIGPLGGSEDKGLLDYLTIHSNGKININTAPVEVLQSLSAGLDQTIAEAIVEFRAEEDFASVQDLQRIAGIDQELINEIKERVTVKSSAFTIQAHGEYREASASITAVVAREADDSRLVYWRVI
jgi:general secretion pathway protein K